MKLLSRDQFRLAVFARDNHRCVFCAETAQDAHHILERRLWPDGGYYLNNGASVCEPCHLKCERTEYSVEEVREAARITKKIIPPHLYDDLEYDKWGNIVMPNGSRLRGELFNDESVQKVLKEGNKLDLFSTMVKYPRTYHLPWSMGCTDDDRMTENLEHLKNQRVIVTEKMDGENTSLYSDGIHARSIDGRTHPSRNWVKNMWSQFASDIPKGWRICGENLYAKHSIGYLNLPSYFMGFSIWNDRNECLDWDTTIEWFTLLNIKPVPLLYDGVYDEKKIKSLYDVNKNYDTSEGYVLRVASGFNYGDFRRSVFKFVRPNHVTADQHHWFAKAIVPNKLNSND